MTAVTIYVQSRHTCLIAGITSTACVLCTSTCTITSHRQLLHFAVECLCITTGDTCASGTQAGTVTDGVTAETETATVHWQERMTLHYRLYPHTSAHSATATTGATESAATEGFAIGDVLCSTCPLLAAASKGCVSCTASCVILTSHKWCCSANGASLRCCSCIQ